MKVFGTLAMRVDVYRNLHRNCLSVVCRDTARPDYGRVIAHRDEVWLCNVQFIVRESGRQRVLRDRRKNVHAFVRGELLEQPPGELNSGLYPVDSRQVITYNPYVDRRFFNSKTSRGIESAPLVHVFGKTILAYGV